MKRLRNTKIDGKVTHLTGNNVYKFQGQRSKVKVTWSIILYNNTSFRTTITFYSRSLGGDTSTITLPPRFIVIRYSLGSDTDKSNTAWVLTLWVHLVNFSTSDASTGGLQICIFLFYQQFWNEVLSKIEIFAFANQNIGNVKLQGERSLTVWQGEWRSIIAYVTHAICTAPLICVVLVYFVNVNVGKLDYAALTRQFKSTHFIISHHHCSGNCQITCWYCKWNLNEVYFYIALH